MNHTCICIYKYITCVCARIFVYIYIYLSIYKNKTYTYTTHICIVYVCIACMYISSHVYVYLYIRIVCVYSSCAEHIPTIHCFSACFCLPHVALHSSIRFIKEHTLKILFVILNMISHVFLNEATLVLLGSLSHLSLITAAHAAGFCNGGGPAGFVSPHGRSPSQASSCAVTNRGQGR